MPTMEISPVMSSARNKRIRMRVENVFECLIEILYLILDYPHKHYTFKHFEV